MNNVHSDIKIVHIVTNLLKINFGIWNAAVFGSEYLNKHFRVSSFLWVCSDSQKMSIPGVDISYLDKRLSKDNILNQIQAWNLHHTNTIFVSHGCWQTPTRLGFKLQKMGFKWLYVPHGMLEPWSMQHKKWKKFLYFSLIEKRLTKKAHGIRAVSEVEKQNLQIRFGREIFKIENGVKILPLKNKKKNEKVFLFMARLHHKKGILPLVKAWTACTKTNKNYKLVIAGPDEGELIKIQSFLNADETLEYKGAVYGDAKQALLERAHYFVLPSHSEGFPTSVVEAMSYGLVPLISSGCNFQAVFTEKLGYQIEPDEKNISDVLDALKKEDFNEQLSFRNHQYIQEHNSEKHIAEQLLTTYTNVLEG